MTENQKALFHLQKQVTLCQARIGRIEARLNAGHSPLAWEKLTGAVQALEAGLRDNDRNRLPSLLRSVIRFSYAEDTETIALDIQREQKALQGERLLLDRIHRKLIEQQVAVVLTIAVSNSGDSLTAFYSAVENALRNR